MHLDSAQQNVVNTILGRRVGVIGVQGAAGSGKTTLVKALLEALGQRLILCSPTGKACARLAQKTGGVAHTLHSLLMQPTYVEEQARGLYDPIEGRKGKMHFGSKHAELPPGKVLVVDEASMITRSMYAELQAFTKDALLVLIGDAFQLAPVADGNFSVFEELEQEEAGRILTLTRVHRQAEGSAVLDAANRLIAHYAAGENKPLEALDGLPSVDQYDLLETMKKGFAEHGSDGFICLTYKNSARDEITAAFRKYRGLVSGTLVAGEPLVITRNSAREHDLYNGDIALFVEWLDEGREYHLSGSVTRVRRASLMNTRTKKLVSAALLLTASNLSNEDRKKLDKDFGRQTLVLLAEYAYCLTAHKAQGSEWSRVVVAYDDLYANTRQQKYRWTYTALTRASKEAIICELHRSSPLSFKRPRPPTAEECAARPLLAMLSGRSS